MIVAETIRRRFALGGRLARLRGKCACPVETLFVAPVVAALSTWLSGSDVDGVTMSFWWRHRAQRALNAPLVNATRALRRRR